MCAFIKLICVFRHFSIFNFSSERLLSNLDKEMTFCLEYEKDFKKIGDIPEVDIHKDHFILRRDLDSCVCIFEGGGSKSMFDLACSDLNFANAGWPMSLKQFVAMQKHSSTMTARWLRHDSGHTLKVWAHMPKHDYEKCETEKCKNRGQKWRHMIYSYAIMALLWNAFNGNKEGPLGHYPTRSAQRMALGGSSSSETMQVYSSKKGGFPVDYVGHNVVALAVGKRGDILRIAYNHNTLFSSTVDHAEERLIDGLYREPTALVQRSHAKIYDGESREKLEIEKHMQHISVYTSLEPCQQCSGKMHLALVPEVISCQRDWDIRLLGDQLYNQFHKCRAVLASHFDFSPYDDLGRTYSSYRERVNRNKVSFFKSDYHHVPAKPTMPYFLCTDEAHAIFKRGHDVFDKVFHILFHKDQSSRPTSDDYPCQFFSKPSTVCAQDKIDLLQLLNIDVSDWLDEKKANDIRNFRPSLSDKKNRILHDELLHLRQSWVSNVFKQMCTLTFYCDRNCTIVESDIETKLSPLGDITSINLIRTVEGHLKGIFTVTFASYETAKNVKESLDKIVIRPASKKKTDVEADFPPGFRENSVGSKRKEYIDASEWLHQIREPLAFELFLPILSNDSKNLSIPAALKPYVTMTKTNTMIRKWPISYQAGENFCETKSKVLLMKCANIASARRLKCELPNFDEPNNIRVTFLPTTEDVRVYTSKVTSPTNVHAGTFTLIARTDVTEGQMLNYLYECFSQHDCSPFSLRFSCCTLTSCNSSQTLKWIDVTSVGMRCFDWKVWSVPFVFKNGSIGAAELGADQVDLKCSILCQMQPSFVSQKLPRRYFCQPYPQSVLDFDVLVRKHRYKLRSILLHPEQSPEQPMSRPALPNPQRPSNLQHKFLFLNVTKVLRTNEKDKAAKEVSILFLLDCEIQSCEVVTDTGTDRSKYVTIDICESSLVTLICSYMLIESRQDVSNLFFFVVTEKGGKYFDFWEKEFQICIATSKEEKESEKDKVSQDEKGLNLTLVEEIIDSLLFIRRRNLLGLCLHMNKDQFLNLTFGARGHGSFVCEFCGVYTDFPALENGERILNVCCAAHAKEEDQYTNGKDQSKFKVPNLEKLKVGHYKIKNLWKKTSEIENELYESDVDPAKDTHPRRSIEKILQKERDLQLELCVSNKSYRASRNVINHIGSVSFLLRRDDVFGPAHILFCMHIPLEMNDSMRFQIGVSGHSSVAAVFGPKDIDIIKRVDTGNRSKKTNAGKGKKVYGRLKDNENEVSRGSPRKGFEKKVKHNQGGDIPADALRKFFEPEYFPELFALDEPDSYPFYPTLDFLVPDAAGSGGSNTVCDDDNVSKSGDVAFASLHSWDFSELQTPELSRLLLFQKQLHVVEFDQLKKRAEILEKQIRLQEPANFPVAPERKPLLVKAFTVLQDHDYFKECLQICYDDNSSGRAKQLTIPLKFKGQLFPYEAWKSLSETKIESPECFIKLLDDLVLCEQSRHRIANFLPKWQIEKFSLRSLVDFLDQSGLHWSKYEELKASIATTSRLDEDEVFDAFLNLIGNGNSNSSDSDSKGFSDASKATIKQRLIRINNREGNSNFENLPEIIDGLVSELELTCPFLKRTKVTLQKVLTARKGFAEKNASVDDKIIQKLKASINTQSSDEDPAEHLFRSFMQLMGINDPRVHFDDSKERIKQWLQNQMGDKDGTSNLHKVVENIGVSLAANIQREKEGKHPQLNPVDDAVKIVERERATFFRYADPIIQAQQSAKILENAEADSVAAFLSLIHYPALLKEKDKKAIKDSFKKSPNIALSSLMETHLPSSLHLRKIQGYFLNVVPSEFGRQEIEHAFGGKTLELKPLDLARNPARGYLSNFQDCLLKGTLEKTLEIICEGVEKHFRDSGSEVVKVQDGRIQPEFGILKELKRLRDCLDHQAKKIPNLTGDYDRAFSACVSLFQNESIPAEATAAAEIRNVDVTFLIIEPKNSEFHPLVTRVVSNAVSVTDAFGTIQRAYGTLGFDTFSSFQNERNSVFWYDGGVVSGENTLQDISYEESKTIYVTAGREGEVEQTAAAVPGAVFADTPASPHLPHPTVKLTRKTLQAMTSKEVAELATRRAFFGLVLDCAETCKKALQDSAISGATYQSDWTRASLEVKLVPHFDESIRLYLRNIVDALLAMKAEADSGKEYSKMLETFKFFLQHDPDNRQCQVGLGGMSDFPTSSSTASSAASIPTPPAAASPAVNAGAGAESGTASAPAPPHAGEGGGGVGKSVFEKVSSTRNV
jgi:tRNA(Arg) A34 adenosine deaminase TadA